MDRGNTVLTDTVLIIDDEESVRASLETLMEEHYIVLTSETGEKGLRKLRDRNVDLIILDVTMPGIGGMATLHRIMDMKDPPEVIMLSASDSARLGV